MAQNSSFHKRPTPETKALRQPARRWKRTAKRSGLIILILLLATALRAADRASLAPFLWTQGQSPEAIRQAIREIAAGGNTGFVWESRPHPDYLGPRWWSDLGVAMAEAKRLGLEIFIEDDYSFPSGGGGGAGGRVVAENPNFRHWVLLDRTLAAETRSGGTQHWEIPGRLGAEEQVVSVVAFPELYQAGREPIDLTPRAQAEGGRSLTWQAPEGKWRLCWSITRPEPGMIDVLNPEAVAAFIRLTHQATWQHFAPEFGKTFQGFFSDEAWMGNTGDSMAASYHSLPGSPGMPMPWSPAFLDYFRRRKGYDPRPLLPALWYDLGPRGRTARFDLMDSYASAFAETFFKPQQEWCHAHGVRLIGHLVEDDADRGLGFGPGHWFRAMQFFDWPGFDVIAYQVTPGMDTGQQWVVNTDPDWMWDEEFEQFGLPAMARGAALIKNATPIFSESFGAYGWSEGLRLIKWIGDWLIVNGVNAVTPHAYSMQYHNPDAPPHFNRAAGNPQWRYYGVWADYFRRLQALSWGSTPLLDAAVLYTAESRWMGPAQSEAPLVRALETRQISSAIIPYDAWATQGSFQDQHWLYHGQRFAGIVLPFVRYVPGAVMGRLAEFAQAGGRVIVIDRYPEASVDGREDAQVRDAVAALTHSPPATLVALQELSLVLNDLGPVAVSPSSTALVVSRRQAPDGEWLFLHNRSLTDTVRGQLRWRGARGQIGRYDPVQDRYFGIPNRQKETALEVEIEIPPYNLQVLRVSRQLPKLEAPPHYQVVQEIPGPWQVSRATDDSGNRFELLGEHRTLEDWRRWAGLENFAGTLRYQCAFQLRQFAPGERLGLDAGAVGEIAELRLNGRSAGVRIAPPYVWDITPLVHTGENSVELDISNTAQARWSDEFSRGDAVSGLLGPVRLLEAGPPPR